MVTLLILDGFGYSLENYGNAILQAGTPYLDKLLKMYPHTLLKCCGKSVGLESGQMGGSEVGHLNIGAGKIVVQELTRINTAIENGNFFNNKAFIKAIEHCKKFNSSLHLIGLLSDGGIHSKIKHLTALVKLANMHGLENVYIHAFMDGRDTPKDSGLQIVSQLESKIEGKAKIASLCGRIYAMDREKRYDRLQKAYDMLVLGRAEGYYQNAIDALEESYKNNIFDEFVEPSIVGKVKKIQSNDSVIFFNFRADRARELTQAIAEQNIKQMQLVNLKNIYFVTMCEYDENFKNVDVAFEKNIIKNNLASIISKNNMKQFHISETTKYAHVTFFLNGGIEKPYEGEERCLIESYDTIDFSTVPQMKAFDITERTMEAIASGKFGFVVVNLSNADMIGHTGNFEATKTAIKCIDKCAYAIALATLAVDGHCIITADHGNAEVMLDKNGDVVTSHTMNPVRFILASEKYKDVELKSGGALCNIAPTILKLLDIELPKDMEESLF